MIKFCNNWHLRNWMSGRRAWISTDKVRQNLNKISKCYQTIQCQLPNKLLKPLVRRKKSIANWLVLFYINFYLQFVRDHLSFKASLILRYLLSNYEQSVRPVENSSLPLTVEFSVSLHQVNKLYFWVNFPMMQKYPKVPYCYLQCFSASGQ